MALSANTVWEVRTVGNDTNGGGFVTGSSGTDYSQQDAKNTAGSDISTTDAVANGSTTITSATANFGTSIVGNVIYLQGGTGALAAGWYHVSARTDASTITVDRVVAAGTGITMNIGGALASMGGAGLSAIGGNIIYIKSGSYTISTASTNVSGGCLSKVTTDISVIGYGTTRNDWGTKPVLTASGISSFTIITGGQSNSGSMIANLQLDGADLTSSRGINFIGIIYNVIAEDFTNGAIGCAAGGAINCLARSCSAVAPFNGAGQHFGCIAHSNTIAGFSGSTTYKHCIAYGNTGASTDGFSLGAGNAEAVNCVAYGNGRDGFRASVANVRIVNCIAEGNTGVGFNASGNSAGQFWLANAAYNNGTNFSLGTGKTCFNESSVTGTASFFTNPATGDFSLNNTTGGGAEAKAAGYPGTYVGGTPVGYADIGAVQTDATATSSGGAGSGNILIGHGGISVH